MEEIFTKSVKNILPNEVGVGLSYDETTYNFDKGLFVLDMVKDFDKNYGDDFPLDTERDIMFYLIIMI